MKTKISVYWPLAVAAALAGMAALQAYGGNTPHTPLPVAQVGTELARAVSYGLVGGATVEPLPAAPAASAQAS